jgi:hypothetical protein
VRRLRKALARSESSPAEKAPPAACVNVGNIERLARQWVHVRSRFPDRFRRNDIAPRSNDAYVARSCSCRFSIVRRKRSSREPSTAAMFVAAVASSTVPSARGARCTWFSRATAPAGLGPCASTTALYARCCVAWRIGSMSASTTLPTWVRTCTSCCARAGARGFRRSCARLRESSPGESRGQEGPARVGPSSTVSPGREWSHGVAITGACGTMFFGTKSRARRAREFGRPSSGVPLERSIHHAELLRDRLRPVSFPYDRCLFLRSPR